MKKVGDDQGNMEGRLISFLFHDLDVFFFPSAFIFHPSILSFRCVFCQVAA